MSKALIWTAVALVVVAGGAYAYVRGKIPDLGPAGPNRQLAPASVSVYVELRDLGGTWAKTSATEAWTDLCDSHMASAVRDLPAVKDLLAVLDQAAAKAAYPIDTTNTLKFVGRECSIGLAFDAGSGTPNVLVLTKLDTDALARDFLGGKLDLGALQEEFERRTGNCDFTMSRTEYHGHSIAAAQRGTGTYFGALLGDTLAVATNEALVHGAIDCRVGGGDGSIGKLPAFQADMAALGPGANVVEWYDLDALDARRAELGQFLESAGVPAAGVGAANAILDGTRGAHSVARATFIPDGDVYRATWKFSKSAELFADRASPPISSLFRGDWTAYAETRDLAGVTTAWKRSALKRKLAAGEMGRWFDRTLDDPGSKLGSLAAMAQGGADLLADTGKLLDRFTMRMAGHLAAEWFDAILAGETAMVLDWDGSETPRGACALRLGAEGRILVLAAGGAFESGVKGTTSQTSGTRKVYSSANEKEDQRIHWTLAGDVIVLSNDLDVVRTAALGGDAATAGTPAAVRDGIAALAPGWRVAAYVDFERFGRSLEGWSSKGGSTSEEAAKLMENYRENGTFGSRFSCAVYVTDDFGEISLRSRTWLAEAKTPDGVALRASSTDRDPRCFTTFPETTFLHAVNPSNGVLMTWMSLRMALETLGPEVEKFRETFRETMDMDLEKELLPALGGELAFAVTRSAARPEARSEDAPEELVLPGFVLGIEVKDAAVVKRALDRALELLQDEAGDQPSPPHVSREP